MTPDVVLHADTVHLTCPHPSSAARLKTWLGLRYDRPAVPEAYVDLARAIAERITRRKNRLDAGPVRDILAAFDTAVDGTIRYQLVAVMPSAAATANSDLTDKARDWLTKLILDVPARLGAVAHVDAYRDDQISLAFLERAYSLDVSSVSWPGTKPGPTGAVG